MLLTLSGCASSPTKLPDWTQAEPTKLKVVDPVKLPLLCAIGETTEKCNLARMKYELVAESNFEIATGNASALRTAKQEISVLINAGTAQNQLMDFYMKELQSEKQGRFWDGLFYKTLIGVGLVVLP